MSDEAIKTQLEPLKITCSSSRCASNLHYFRQTKKMRKNNEPPICKECKADLVDWPRVRQCDLNDVEHTFLALKLELIRHSYWHRPFDQKAINYALRKGKVELFKAAKSRIKSSVGKPADSFDWSGTSWEGNPICYAQHATAACCRKCIEKWHGISRDQDLTEDQITYLTRLVVLYLEDRLPDLPDNKQKVPSIRRKAAPKEKK